MRFAHTSSGTPCDARDFAAGSQPIPGVSGGKDAMASHAASSMQVLSWLRSLELLLRSCLRKVSWRTLSHYNGSQMFARQTQATLLIGSAECVKSQAIAVP